MSAKAQREQIKGARTGAPVKASAGKRKARNVIGIPEQDHTQRDAIIERLKRRKDS